MITMISAGPAPPATGICGRGRPFVRAAAVICRIVHDAAGPPCAKQLFILRVHPLLP
jgi:hypothetical protein